MKRTYIYFLIIFVILFAFTLNVYALGGDIDMNASTNSDSQNTNTTSNNTANSTVNTTTNNETGNVAEINNNTNNTPAPQVQNTPKNSQDFFTAENILNIILITIGVVLILLGIAIFIRAK